ncbi:MAG: PAS domain S-box protein [Candidatus Aminicenantes bacterium]|nr:PAS domain S-box protein [Candidatus Aminicenantes bacterium]
MRESPRTKAELIAEISELKQKIKKLEKSEAKRKQAESQMEAALEAMKNSEGKYRGLTENINLGIYRNTVGPEGKFIEANPAIVAMFGFKSKGEFLAINVSDLYQDSKDREKFNKKMLKEGVVKSEELWLKKKDGSIFVGSVSAVAIKDERGRVKYYDGIIDNIDNRKRAESQVKAALAALRESEERFRTLYENSTLGIYRSTLDGRVLLANPALVRMLGYSSFAELTTRDLEKNGFEPAYPRSRFIEMIEKEGEVKGLESAWTRKDGVIIFIRENAAAIKDAQGKTLYYDGTVEDISERKQAEADLVKSKALLSDTEKMGKIGGWTFDVETMTQTWTEETFRILEIDLTNGEPKVPEGLEFIAPAFRPLAEKAIQRAVEFGEPYDQEWEIITQKGNKRWVHAVATTHQEQGKTKSVSGSFQDITGRKLAESQREVALAALRESEARQQLILATLPIASYTSPLDPAIDASWVSGNVEKVTGFTVEQYLATKDFWRNRLHADDRERVLAAYRNQAAGDEIVLEYRWLCKDGNYKWFHDRTIKKHTQQGMQYFGIILDISERK